MRGVFEPEALLAGFPWPMPSVTPSHQVRTTDLLRAIADRRAVAEALGRDLASRLTRDSAAELLELAADEQHQRLQGYGTAEIEALTILHHSFWSAVAEAWGIEV